MVIRVRTHAVRADTKHAVGILVDLTEPKKTDPRYKGLDSSLDLTKVGDFADHVRDFFQTRKRQLPCGDIVDEKVSNLAKYRSAVKNTLGHEVERYSLVVPPEQVISWEAKMKSYFDALKKSEQTLKSKGKMPSRTGSLNFSMGLYRATSLRL